MWLKWNTKSPECISESSYFDCVWIDGMFPFYFDFRFLEILVKVIKVEKKRIQLVFIETHLQPLILCPSSSQKVCLSWTEDENYQKKKVLIINLCWQILYPATKWLVLFSFWGAISAEYITVFIVIDFLHNWFRFYKVLWLLFGSIFFCSSTNHIKSQCE